MKTEKEIELKLKELEERFRVNESFDLKSCLEFLDIEFKEINRYEKIFYEIGLMSKKTPVANAEFVVSLLMVFGMSLLSWVLEENSKMYSLDVIKRHFEKDKKDEENK